MTKIWEIMSKFKEACRCQGWRTSESNDWIELDDKIHNFLWARNVPISSFKKIVSNGKCVVREGLSYRVVKASYCAWLFSDTPSKSVVETILDNPDLSSKIALYDLSPLMGGQDQCVRLNYTDSSVFKEFESFLMNELGVKVSAISPSSNSDCDAEKLTVAGLA